MGPLAQLFSTSESLRRRIVDALRNPVGATEQFVGNQTDKARNLQGMTQAATDEFVNTGTLKGPQQAKLDQLVAESYNPIGMVGVTGPRSKALETARQNAVKMLGLPENNTAMDRAKALGFVDDAFHGTPDDKLVRSRQFKDEMLGKSTQVSDAKLGHFTASTGDAASEYIWRDGDAAGGNVLPLMLRGDRVAVSMPGEWSPGKFDKVIEQAKRAGYDGVTLKGTTTLGKAGDYQVTFNPANIRSRFAAFDPARINESDILGRASVPFLGLLGIGAGGAAYLSREKE